MKWRERFYAVATIIILMLFATMTTVGAKSNGSAPLLKINPGNFVRKIDNPYFPLKPGTTFTYKGTKDGAPTRDVVAVTNNTKKILGVTCTVVHHRSFEDGVFVEDTFDYYAQDKEGTVWYFGEDTKELDENGNVVTTEGTWRAGVDGAQPGVIMKVHPKKGDRYPQEVAPDVAEDMAQVLSLNKSICVSYGCFDHVLLTREWSPLEKGVVENKYYAKGVGFIFSVMVKGGDEESELVRVK